MQNEMMESAAVATRDINTITAEIKDICQRAKQMALYCAVEIGRRLEEAKQMLPHGAWGEWLKTEVEFLQSTADNYMRLFKGYGTGQISIFGAMVNSQSIANLPYSKALQLLAIPQEERESFAKEVDAENLSVKELKDAIAERDRAREAEAAAVELLAETEAAKEEALKKAAEAERLREDLSAREAEVAAARANTEKLQAQLKKRRKILQFLKRRWKRYVKKRPKRRNRKLKQLPR